MGRVIFRIADYDGEVSTATFQTSDLTAANIDGEYTEAVSLQTALDGISLGLVLNREHVAKSSPQAVGKAASELAQREAKALVSYYDATTFERSRMEIPAIDLSLQLTGHPGYFYDKNYAGDEEAAVTAFVTAFEATVVAAGGNAAVIDTIVHVGRNL
jgi:hypothetical protein